VGLSSAEETRAAIASAQAAFEGWSKTPPLARARVMFRFKDLIEARRDDLARLISSEHGKVFSDAQGRSDPRPGTWSSSPAAFRICSRASSRRTSAAALIPTRSMQPLGVCVGITPFNFPAMVPLWMLPVAIACGNSFILKPSEKVPSTALLLGELLIEAGLPAGVLNIVNGDKEAVDVLLSDERVQSVSFVGSTPVAEYIYRTASAHGKRCQALGGAKNHMVIMPDADPKQVVGSLMGAAYGSAGERCMAISVAVCVGDEVADKLVGMLKAEIAQMVTGPGTGVTPEPHMGPLISREHQQKVRGYIDLGVEEGAELVCDGRGLQVLGHEDGFFVGPTLFDRVTPQMRIYQEEIFGPVLSVLRVQSFDEALALVNAHEYGNGTSIFTRDGDTAHQYEENVKVGMVGINVPIPVPMAFHCFGGWKRSIFGALNMHGPDGVRFFTRMKTVTRRWPTGVRAGAEFSMPTMG